MKEKLLGNENKPVKWKYWRFMEFSPIPYLVICLSCLHCPFQDSKHHLRIPLKSFPHPRWCHNIPSITNIFYVFALEGELNSCLHFIKDSEWPQRKPGFFFFPFSLEKWNKNKVGNLMGAIYRVVERVGKAEHLGYRPGSASEELLGLESVLIFLIEV